jgi:hypothetical protein
MLTIKCAKCKRPVFKYVKVGEGRLRRCYKSRIVKDYSLREGNEVRCQCGNLIGIDEGRWIKMKGSSFIYSGTVVRK